MGHFLKKNFSGFRLFSFWTYIYMCVLFNVDENMVNRNEVEVLFDGIHLILPFDSKWSWLLWLFYQYFSIYSFEWILYIWFCIHVCFIIWFCIYVLVHADIWPKTLTCMIFGAVEPAKISNIYFVKRLRLSLLVH